MASITNLIKNSAVLFLANAFAKVFFFIYSIILTQSASAEDAGIFFLCITLNTLLQAITNIGLSTGIIHFATKDEYSKSALYSTAIIVPLIVYILCLAVLITDYAQELTAHFLHASLNYELFLLMSVSCLQENICYNLSSLSRSQNKILLASSIQHSIPIISKLLVTVFAVFMLTCPVVFRFVYGYVAGSCVAVILANYFYFKAFKPKFRIDFNLCYLVSAYSLPLSVSYFITVAQRKIDTLLVASFLNLKFVAYYEVMARIVGAFDSVIQMFRPVVEPEIAKDYYTDKAKLELLLSKIILINLIFAMFIVCFVFAIPDKLLSIFGAEYKGEHIKLVILILSNVFFVISGFDDSILMLSGNQLSSVVSNILATVFNIILSLYLIPHFGLIGAAISSTLTCFLTMITRHSFTMRTTGINFLSARYTYKLLLVSSITMLSIIAVRCYSDSIFITLPTLSVVYFALTFIFFWDETMAVFTLLRSRYFLSLAK